MSAHVFQPGGSPAGFSAAATQAARDELQRAGEALARNEERLSATLAVAGIVGLWDGDLKNGLVYGDANFARIYGMDPAVVARGMPRGNYAEYTHPDDTPLVRAAIDRMLAGADIYACEQRIFHPADGLRWVLTQGRLVRDADGTPVRFAGIALDITGRKLAEARQAFLLELADAMRALSDPTAILDAALSRLGRHLGANRVGYGRVQADDATVVLVAAHVDGVAPLEGSYTLGSASAHVVALHRRGKTVAHADVTTDERYKATAWAAMETRAFVSVPLVRDGRFTAALYVHHREPHTWSAEDVALIEDVAARIWEAVERGRSEAALRQLNSRLEQMVEERTQERDRLWELSQDLLVTADYDGGLVRFSPSWTRLLGFSAAELLAGGHRPLMHPDDTDAAFAALTAMRTSGQAMRLEGRSRCADGSWRWIAWTLSPEPGGQRYSGIGRDITAAKARQAELESAQEALRQSQKMEAVGQLTGGLAHDFNNLLAGIQGSLELIAVRTAQGRHGEIGRYVAAAQGATQRAAALTHRLLAFSRKQTLDPKPVDVNRLIGGLADLVRRTVGPSISVQIAPAVGLWPTLVDPNQLENALLNLCINARDAMEGGGRLCIETGNQTFDAAAAARCDLAPGDYVAIRVRDSGAGMPADVIARAFDPFFTTKAIGKGTGLGLSMIYGFVRQSGGQAKIVSSVGRGTTVSLFLPRHDGPVDQPTAAVADVADVPPTAHHETVLVVDDEATVRMLVRDLLDERGYTTLQAADGAEALARLRERGRVDLLVTDVGLPGSLNGRQLAEAARRLQPGLRVLFITGYADGSIIDPLQLDAGMQVLVKPFALEALAGSVEAMLSRA